MDNANTKGVLELTFTVHTLNSHLGKTMYIQLITISVNIEAQHLVITMFYGFAIAETKYLFTWCSRKVISGSSC